MNPRLNSSQDMLSMRRSSCRPRDKKRMQQCLLTARAKDDSQNNNNRQSRKSDYCEVRYQCYQQVRYSQTCYDRSARVLQAMCSCTKSLPVSSYKDIYQRCLEQNG